MLSSLTITDAHAQLSAKKISATELAQACIDRIESVDKTVHAVVHRSFERALDEARKIDAKGDFSHPLTGIPFLTKDVFSEVGVPTTACSNVLQKKDYVPPFESTTTKRLKEKGAFSLGKVNTDEFTMGSSTETSCFGVTKNPWDTSRVPGGSSGGSGAAVAADECLFALGTDTGGSIRLPASYCGCVGLRVTYGRTSRFGAMSMASSLDTTGALTKTVEDMAIVLGTIAGFDPLDATTGKKDVPAYQSELKKSVKGLRLGLPKEYFNAGLQDDVRQGIMAAVKKFEELGASIHEVSLPFTKYAVAAYYVLCPCEVSSNMARYDGIRFGRTMEKPNNLIEYYETIRSEGFGDEVRRRIMIGTFALSAGYFDAYYKKAQQVRTLIKKDFATTFNDVDILLSPVSPSVAFTIGAHANDPIAMYLEDAYAVPQALAGIPSLSLPCGFSRDGLPIGLQMMAPQWHETQLLQAAYAYEQATQEFRGKKPVL